MWAGNLQDVLSQWQFISVRRQVEKGRYYYECNRPSNDEEARNCDISSVVGNLENAKVSKSNLLFRKSHTQC